MLIMADTQGTLVLVTKICKHVTMTLTQCPRNPWLAGWSFRHGKANVSMQAHCHFLQLVHHGLTMSWWSPKELHQENMSHALAASVEFELRGQSPIPFPSSEPNSKFNSPTCVVHMQSSLFAK